ncbi:MAG: arginine deiminase-related protein [Saprospiraceae bacterium]|nr:arginine deiminase-related protein [Saprospiraceae bacterium]
MRQQTTPCILMIRPARFAFNEETAANNAFQQRAGGLTADAIRKRAAQEFDALVARLREAGVQVIVAPDSARPPKPDAVFPNNWVTFHQEGFVITYPMYAPSRRKERRRSVIDTVLNAGFKAGKRINLEFNEKIGRFLEGTGSIIFDHRHRLAYACLSPRTDAALLQELCDHLAYEPVVFSARDAKGQDIYHTNVMMAMGETFVVICLDSVRDPDERQMLLAHFQQTGKEVVDITLDQMNHFAGNMLQVRNTRGETILVMSEQAYRSLTPAQVSALEKHTRLLYSSLDTIETFGGGSARCMMAEVFLPQNSSYE